MATLADISMTVVCVMALALAGWWFFGRMLRPIPGPGVRAVIWAEGDGTSLEHSVRSLMWLRGLGLLYCPVVIVDRGLDERGREVARRLDDRWPAVILDPGMGTKED